MSDQGFPIIEYADGMSPQDWGLMHGESFRAGIHELIQIRRSLMLEKNPQLTLEHVSRLAHQQWQITCDYDPPLAAEIEAISQGAGASIEDIVILNNYTDFRDIQVPDQGCSVVVVNYDQGPVAGQTWDMHGSAKDYVCCLRVPQPGFTQPAILYSIVGCVGMMGIHPRGSMVGVNNINTDGARAGVLWPCVVRRILQQHSHAQMVEQLRVAPVTSGHTYLIASLESSEFWEVMPGLAERVSRLDAAEDGFLFHTNHCLGPQARQRESAVSMNSTTHIRYELLEKKITAVRTLDDVYQLLNDHENYPKSICSNFQIDSQDPSITCGGAAAELKTGQVRMWRGDPEHDANFRCHSFQLGASQVA